MVDMYKKITIEIYSFGLLNSFVNKLINSGFHPIGLIIDACIHKDKDKPFPVLLFYLPPSEVDSLDSFITDFGFDDGRYLKIE